MPVVIPPEVAKTLLPRRPEDAGKPKRVKAKTAWGHIKEATNRYKRKSTSGVDIALLTGQSLAATDEIRASMATLYELLQGDEPPATWTLEVASALLAYSFRSSIELLEETSGLPFAFDARLESLRFVVKHDYNQAGAFLLEHHGSAVGARDLSLRGRILQASSDVRAACKEIARRRFPTASLEQKTTIAYAFFEEEEWVNDVARQWLSDDAPRHLPLEMLYATLSDLDLLRAVVAKRSYSRAYVEMVVSFGEASFDLLAEAFKAPKDSWDLKHAATALALFDDPRAAELLVSAIGNSSVRPLLAELCVRFPKTARAAIEPIAAKGKGRPAKLANELLATIAKTEANAPPKASDGEGEGEEEEPVDRELTTSRDEAVAAHDVATTDELPWILVTPPWLDRKKIPKRTWPTLASPLSILPREEHVRLSPALVRAALEAADPTTTSTFKPEPEVEGGRSRTLRLMNDENARIDDDALFEHWNRGGDFTHQDQHRTPDIVAYIFHRFGTRAIPGFELFLDGQARYQHRGDKKILVAVDSPVIALRVAGYLDADSRGYWEETWGPHARRWFRTYPETAVIGLVPSLLSGDNPHAHAAERALRYLRDDQKVDVIALARPYGSEACAAIEQILAWDPRFDLPKRMPKLPPSFRPESLTPPLLKDSARRLPRSAIEHIAAMLSFSPMRFAYPGIADVKAACDPRSLAEHAWDLAKAWEMAGSKGNHSWMVTGLAHFADDEVVRRTTPAMRSQSVSEILKIIGTDAAVMELVTIGARADSGNAGYAWASNVVERRIDLIAAERGMTGKELEESVLPVREIDYKGFQLDFGGRVLDVAFDERLEAFIVGEDGLRLRALPPGRKTDDKKKVEAAKRVWQDLKEEVSAVVARRLSLLERSMVHGDTWTLPELEMRFIEHPLLRHLGRVLLFEGVLPNSGDEPAKSPPKRFRITEDGKFADVSDHTFTLEPNALVRLAHPARMNIDDPIKNEEEVAAWVQLFFDYRIVQPFPQVSRTIRALPEAERKERVFTEQPKDLSAEELTRRMRIHGASSREKLSRGEAVMATTYANKMISSVTLRFLPTWVDFDPVEMAESLAMIRGVIV